MTVTLVIIAVIFGWGIFSYNRLVRDRVRVETGWSDISVQLKRRHDLIPKLVAAVRQYAAYESATLETVTAIRAQERDATKSSSEEQAISVDLKKLIALAEQYPVLKADQSFLELQKNLSHVEHHLQYARRYYNGAVRNLNIRVDSFPDKLIARAFNFSKAVFFEFDAVAEGAE